MSWETTIIIFILSFKRSLVFGEQSDEVNSKKFYDQVEFLIRSWAPLIYLAPGELFKPSGIDDFVKNVYPANADGLRLTKKVLQNEKLYMKTLQDVESLKNDKASFLHGKDDIQSVPAYGLVTYCHKDPQNVESKTSLNFFVSYWFFYPYNLGKEICFLGRVPTPSVFSACFGRKVYMGDHVGDWEHVTLSFRGEKHPDSIFVSTHEFGAYYKYNKFLHTFIYESQRSNIKMIQNIRFPKFLLLKNNHPVLFSAWGSHGFWSEPGNHTYSVVPKLQDFAGFGNKWETWKNLKIYHMGFDGLPKWISFRGRWGNPRSNCILFKNLGLCKQADGPFGPRNSDFTCSKK
ncbi:vacuolar protein sorting-associated protein 62 isoform X1 [Harmonia axyridis]|uniref:vacuolar protein sorting-associated protein 62 isoform X1 n=1 Tax=Harmonia axyridis TaxID=115357 RepID=UPI001E27870D|nr:vacuolar protein sorting-associated protein 62 isoform X1 [Harmonia axyridis]